MKKILAAIGTIVATVCLFIFKNVIAPSATEIVKTDVKPYITKMIKAQLDKTDFFKSDDEKLAQNMGDQLLTKNNVDISCKEGESEQQCQARILEISGFNELQKKLDIFNETYEKCYDDVGRNPYVDLENHTAVYRETIKCLIVNNQGEILDSIAKSEPHLATTVYQVKQSISHTYR